MTGVAAGLFLLLKPKKRTPIALIFRKKQHDGENRKDTVFSYCKFGKPIEV